MEGLGFVVGGNVLDKRVLKRIYVAMISTLAVLVPFMLAAATQAPVAPTVYGQLPGTDRVYAYSPGVDVVSTIDAYYYCKSLGVNMTSIHNKTENDAIVQLINSGELRTLTSPFGMGTVPAVYIGAWKLPGSLSWQWLDSTQWNYTNFAWRLTAPSRPATTERASAVAWMAKSTLLMTPHRRSNLPAARSFRF